MGGLFIRSVFLSPGSTLYGVNKAWFGGYNGTVNTISTIEQNTTEKTVAIYRISKGVTSGPISEHIHINYIISSHNLQDPNTCTIGDWYRIHIYGTVDEGYLLGENTMISIPIGTAYTGSSTTLTYYYPKTCSMSNYTSMIKNCSINSYDIIVTTYSTYKTSIDEYVTVTITDRLWTGSNANRYYWQPYNEFNESTLVYATGIYANNWAI